MKRTYLWVVEMQFGGIGAFTPTVGIGFAREDGRIELRRWSENNPLDKFRLRKYVATEGR